MRGCLRMATPSMPHAQGSHWLTKAPCGHTIFPASQLDRGGAYRGILARLPKLHAETKLRRAAPEAERGNRNLAVAFRKEIFEAGSQ